MPPKHVSVIVVPHDNSKTRNFRFSYRLMYVFVAVVGTTVISLLLFMFSYGRVLVAAQRSLVLGRENTRLRHRVAQMDSLKFELLQMQVLSIQVKGMLGVELTAEDSLFVVSLSPTATTSTIPMDEPTEGVGVREQQNMLEALPSLWPIRGYVTREMMMTGGDSNPQYHPGIDIAVDRGTPVRATAEGVVEASRFDETYGWMVEIDHGYGVHSVYGHNERNLVNVGDRVTRGKTIAIVGSTGKSTAPHLHFEIRKNGVPVDPRQYLLN